MTREEIKSFTLRTTEANACELIVILYDVILTDTKNARNAFRQEDFERFRSDLNHAAKFLNELIRCLDFNIPLSGNLASLYAYMNRRISYAAAGNHVEALDIVDEIVLKLRDAFEHISKDDQSGPMMKNTQSLYAGLTYGKGYLNETYVDPRDYNRGFNA